MTVLLLILIALIAYGLGSLNGAILVGRFVYHKDVRKYGSGNAGLTNFYRSFGASSMAMVALVDVLKSVLAVLLGGALLKIVDARETGMAFAGFCLILGHMFPLIYQFRGGKGVLCGITMTYLLDWRVGLCCTLLFGLLVIFTGYVSLGSVVATALCPALLGVFGHAGLTCTLVILSALLIVIKHLGNILRLVKGTESKLRFGGRRPGRDEDFDDEDE